MFCFNVQCLNSNVVILQMYVNLAPWSVQIYRTGTVGNYRTTKILRKNTGVTEQRSPPFSFTSSRGLLRNHIILTCTAEKSSRSRSTCPRFEYRCVQQHAPFTNHRMKTCMQAYNLFTCIKICTDKLLVR